MAVTIAASGFELWNKLAWTMMAQSSAMNMQHGSYSICMNANSDFGSLCAVWDTPHTSRLQIPDSHCSPYLITGLLSMISFDQTQLSLLYGSRCFSDDEAKQSPSARWMLEQMWACAIVFNSSIRGCADIDYREQFLDFCHFCYVADSCIRGQFENTDISLYIHENRIWNSLRDNLNYISYKFIITFYQAI